jgi:Family of unknown function (DUF5318)
MDLRRVRHIVPREYNRPTMSTRTPRQAGRRPLGRNPRAEMGVIDFRLAKRALLRDAQVGVIGLTDICDAHPELIRAAKHVGEPTRNDCPVCGKVKLVLLAYVYGDGLRDQNGRVWSIDNGLKMIAAHPGASCYVVEVCTECQWNHLHEALTARRSAAG